MELLSLASEYLRIENDEYDSEPRSVGVRTVDYPDNSEFEISGRFPEEEVKDESYVFKPSKSVSVEKESKMYAVFEHVMEHVRENVVVSNGAEITSIHIGGVGSTEEMPDEWSFYTSEMADYRILVCVEREGLPSEVRSELLELVINGLYKLDSEIIEDEIQTAEFLFSDMKPNNLEGVRGYVETPRPHKYYNDVGSVKEYVNTLVDNLDETEEMYSKDVYEVFYDLDWVWDISVLGYTGVENFMDKFVLESLDIFEWEFIVEGEYICFGDFKDKLLSEGMQYYIHIPVTEGNIGISK